MFDPKISEQWNWNAITPTGSNPIPLEEYCMNLKAIAAVPELLMVYRAAREFKAVSEKHWESTTRDDLNAQKKLNYAIERLESIHGEKNA